MHNFYYRARNVKDLLQLETLREIKAIKHNKEDWFSKTGGLEQQTLGALNIKFKEIYGLGLEYIEPWAAYGFLGLQMLPSQEQGVDATLLAQANQANKRIFYLEPFELYIDVVTKGRTLKWDDILPLFSAPATSIDESKLSSAFGYNFSSYEKYILEADQHLHPQDFIIKRRDERNEVWFPNLVEYYQEATAPLFGTVGSEHAVGRKGIVNFFLQENYIVKQMTSDGDFPCPLFLVIILIRGRNAAA